MVDIEGLPSSADALKANCAVCRAVVESFSAPVEEHIKISLGIAGPLLDIDCHYHTEYLSDDIWRFGDIPDFEEQELFLERGPNSASIVFTCEYDDGFNYTDQMLLLQQPNIAEHPGTARLLDEDWIDESLLCHWIETCDAEHDGCKDPGLLPDESLTRPKYLIDVIDNCLVLAKHVTGDYVALSYVWGRSETLRNKKSILERLLQPGALRDNDLAVQIPNTVKDAIALVRHLGQRFLWVDAICIVQDNPEELGAELGRMPGIYGAAYFTIVAANGTDANHGLRGFKGISAPRNMEQEVVELAGGERLVARLSTLGPSGSTTYKKLQIPYHRRAWTFQEYLFSSRRLVFTGETVHWECLLAECWEDTVLVPGPHVRQMTESEGVLRIRAPIPRLLSYTICEFNQKSLTFPEDSLAAFTGIQTILQNVFPKGLLYGIPVFFFDVALMWFPQEDISRRIASGSQVLGQAVSGDPPSWSWLGWYGSVSFPNDYEFAAHDGGSLDGVEGFLDPVTQWYALSHPSSATGQRIASEWYFWRQQSQNGSAEVPQGWVRSSFSETDISSETREKFPRSTPSYCFELSYLAEASQTSSSIPRLLHWYAVPYCEDNEKHQPREQTPYLFCQTSRAFLYGGRLMETRSGGPPRIQILGRTGHFAGYLQLHNSEDLQYFTRGAHASKQVELVAVARGYTARLGLAGERDFRDCYFVLWVEWEVGVAFRRGAGAVTITAWEEARELELVDLTLG